MDQVQEPRQEEVRESATAPSRDDGDVEQLKKQAAEYKDNWLRSAADFQNYRRRVERERAELAEWSNAALIVRLLEVLDGFEAAFNAIPDKFRGEAWVEGIRLVEQKLRSVLTQERVKPMETVGKQFDPNYHEAMWQEPSPGHPEGEILSEFQRGYMLGDRVLRPARVKIVKASDGSTGS